MYLFVIISKLHLSRYCRAAKGIIILKNNHIDPDLVKEIGEKDLNALTEDIKNQYLNPQVKVKDSTFEKLTAIMRVRYIIFISHESVDY